MNRFETAIASTAVSFATTVDAVNVDLVLHPFRNQMRSLDSRQRRRLRRQHHTYASDSIMRIGTAVQGNVVIAMIRSDSSSDSLSACQNSTVPSTIADGIGSLAFDVTPPVIGEWVGGFSKYVKCPNCVRP